jgi:endonuclease YncB( thermonuclease family)
LGWNFAIIANIVATAFVVCACNAFAAEISGAARVVDGDTVEIAATKIRLSGVDSPETDQLCLDEKGNRWACGVSAREELIRHVGTRPWVCQVNGSDRYSRYLATCTVDGEDIQKWMVLNGWALAFVRYSHTYASDETEARKARVGLWAGAFIAPWDWRHRSRQTTVLGSASVPVNAQEILLGATSAAEAPTPGCTTKGNLRADGQCIYHEPGGRWYANLNMTKTGRRWFCTPAEAEAAGCRAAGLK